jgi:hypothetical protein
LPAPSWTDRVWHEFRAGCLTPLHRDVLLRLGEYARCGGIWPSHETLAERARCHVDTVRRALVAGRQLGLVTWAERRVRRGWRWLRSTNVYRLLVPEEPLQPGPRGRRGGCRATTPQVAGGESDKKTKRRCERDAGALADALRIESALADALRIESALPDLLLRRRQALAAQWRAS